MSLPSQPPPPAPAPAPAQAGAAPQAAAPRPSFNPHELLKLYLDRQFDELSEKFLALLAHFEQAMYVTLSPQDQYFVNAFVKHFLFLFTQPDYLISERHVGLFLRYNLVISNLVAVSSFRTTDAHLEVLRDQEANFIKTLTLWSARNSVKFDRRKFFDLDPVRSSVWYSTFCQVYRSGLINEVVCRNLREHYEFRDERLNLTFEPQEAFFGSTYVDGECDRLIKPVVNRSLARLSAQYRIRNTPNPRKVAVLSALWSASHSIYRTTSHYVRALREKYHLTFFQLGGFGLTIDESLFDEVRHITNPGGSIDISPILENDFKVAFFPDVGMSPHSIVLANLRLAPIQVTTLGHSVSTFGAEIDYYISGADVEVPDHPEKNYSERLVLLPDCGVVHTLPQYVPTGRKKTVPELVINCPAFSQKMNVRFCRLLQRIIDECRQPANLRFRLFVGGTLRRQADFLPFFRDIGLILRGARIEIITNRPYPDYMALLEEGDLSIDSFHFGGCNTIADTLFLRLPTVTYEGDKWYNRIGSQMLRMVGTPELIATNDDEYVKIVKRLVDDERFRLEIRDRLTAADLEATIFNTASASSFQDAFDYLIAHHEQLQRETDRTPIRIGRRTRKKSK